MSEKREPFQLRPERIGAAPDGLQGGSVLLGSTLAPEPRDGHGPAIQRILNGEAAEFIMMTYAPGQVLSDHLAAHPITIQCLEGELLLTVGETSYELVPGRVAHVKAMEVHRVECPADAPARNVLLLTMLTAGAQH
ncbi:cupin domain-containing protein [Gulosibacter molinativorax]|nr:cupin domain-containing protein [Gulosibacter molinativorax]QUY63435.1 Hypotetical protein [Gulosibacter molinativorax]